MACLTGIELEREHAFAIESEINRFQAREGANEQSRGQQNHQADDDLCHHQCAAQSQAAGAVRARGRGARFLERGHQIDSRGLQRRRQAEQNASDHRKRHHHRQNVPVHFGV